MYNLVSSVANKKLDLIKRVSICLKRRTEAPRIAKNEKEAQISLLTSFSLPLII